MMWIGTPRQAESRSNVPVLAGMSGWKRASETKRRAGTSCGSLPAYLHAFALRGSPVELARHASFGRLDGRCPRLPIFGPTQRLVDKERMQQLCGRSDEVTNAAKCQPHTARAIAYIAGEVKSLGRNAGRSACFFR